MERRYKLCYVEMQNALGILNGEFIVERLDMPDDARVVDVFVDYPRMALGVVVESMEFEPVPFGVEPPQLPPIAVRRRFNAWGSPMVNA